MLPMSILMRIRRGRGLWDVLGDVTEVHFDAYLQGSQPMGRSGPCCRFKVRKNTAKICILCARGARSQFHLELWVPILMHICRDRGLWGVLGDVADVHFDAYLQGSR